MPRLSDALDALDRLIAAADGVVDPHVLDEAATISRRIRRRRSYLGDTVVVALAGGTGSGKTSLLNAIAGEEVAEAGAQRPTTAAPLAWIPSDPEPGLTRLLDELGIEERVGQRAYPWLALIDLPDTDSVVRSHRATVDRLLPEVDAVVWVVDPEKYQDRALHDGQLRRLSEYGSQFLFAVNQVDRLGPEECEALLDDLRSTLADDGIPDAVIVATAADPPLGLTRGIDELVDALSAFGDARAAVERKLMVDVERAGALVVGAAGGGAGTGFEDRWDAVATAAADALSGSLVGPGTVAGMEAEGRRLARRSASLLPLRREAGDVGATIDANEPPGLDRARDGIDSFVRSLAAETGGIVGGALRRETADLDERLRQVVDRVVVERPLPLGAPPRWWRTFGWVRRIAFVLLILAGAWLVGRLVVGDPLLGPVAALVAAGVMVSAGAVDVDRSGVAWGRRHVDAALEKLRGDFRSELDRTIGRRLREVLRTRAAFVAAHVEFDAVMRRDGGSPLVSDR